MNLTDAQKATVRSWLENGVKLSEIQNRIAAEFGVSLTYMELRFLVDDLKVLPKDPEPAKPADLPASKQAGAAPAAPDEADDALADEETEAIPAPPPLPGAGNVKLTLDTVTLPGAIASGSVTFSDGQTAQWYLDQMGRLGLAPKQKGYRPSPADVQAFQMQLQKEFEKLGY